MSFVIRWLRLGVVAASLLIPFLVRGGVVVELDATWRYLKGTKEASSPDSKAWRAGGFDDASWSSGAAPFFYGEPLTGTELPDMRGGYTSVYLRKSFVIDSPAGIAALRLRALSDDGFIAWINGKEVVRFNVPDAEMAFDGTALGTFSEPLPLETYDIPDFRSILVPGVNVIAVHGFNSSLSGSSDFVFEAALDADIDDRAPRVELLTPGSGARVRELSQVLVGFDEPVAGVDAADLLINGAPATNVTAFAADQYVFEFAAQPKGTVTVKWATAAGIHDLSPAQNPFAGGTWSYTVDPELPLPGVQLSEFMADNRRTLNDEDGDASDWIEIGNTSDQAVSLAGWFLTDSATTPQKWRFPPVSLPARGFIVVFASGKNRTNVAARLHTNFKLDKSGGYLALVRPTGVVASDFGARYPGQEEDVSYGRLATDPLKAGFFPQPTPGAANSEGGPGFAPEVEYSRIGGTFTDSFNLTLAPGEVLAGTEIRFTLDGSVPTEISRLYSAPVAVTNSVRVRARSFTAGLLPGPVRGEYYVQLNPTAVSVTSTLPLVILHSFGGGAVPANGEYPAFVSIYEPRERVASLTNAPDLRTRARLNIRGSSTLGQSKRNYSVEFRDEREVDRDLSPLGMPSESDWVLYAPNNFEPILIHNPLAFQLSNDLGRYAPRTRFVEVYVQTGTGPVSSTSYAGIYVLMEKIKRGPDRIAIDKLEPEHVTSPTVTGGYALKVDRLDPGDGGLYAGGQGMGFVDPKEEDMRAPQRQPQLDYIQKYIDDFGNALYAANWRDPVKGWRAFVDEPSWIDHHLLNVLTFNVDALRLSAYFYKPRGGKLFFGPAWDFDRALNSTDGRDANPRTWRSQSADLGTDFFNYTWWGRMFQDPDFWQAYVDRYQELRRAQFSTNQLFALVDRLTDEVRPAQPREAAKWPGFTTPRGSYAGEITSLKTWLTRRLDFMDTNFVAAPVIAPSGGAAGATFGITGPAGATIFYTVDGTDPRAPGGAPAASSRTYAGPVTLAAGAVLKARSRDLNHQNRTGANNPPISTSWSGPAVARLQSAPGPEPGELAVTEIQYRPALPTAAELASNPLLSRGDFEYFELKNRAAHAVELGALRFTRGVDFSFSTSSIPQLPAGGRLLLVKNKAALALRHGALPGIAGEYAGSLDGGGESLRIEDAAGRIILDARYRDGWHPATDGLGFSLVSVDDGAVSSGTTRDAWRASAAVGGSPGAVDRPAPVLPVVVVNEALTHTDPPQFDGVELLNLSGVPADISGWWLTDDRAVPQKYRLPAGSVVTPGGFLWIDERTFNADTNSPTSFRLDSLGDGAWLFAADAAGRLLGPAHGFAFGAAPNGVSFGRELTCDGDEEFLPQTSVTPGTANAGPRRSPVVISEIHYHPPDINLGGTLVDDTALEFVEIANVSNAAVPLYDLDHATNTWRLKDAVGFVFPENLTLPAGGVWLVANFDPARNPQALARFRTAFGLSASVQIFGPLEGSLANSDGRVELARPDPPQGPADPTPGLVPDIVVDRVAYRDDAPWPVLADGSGRSLQRVKFDATGSEPRAWVASAPSPGSLPSASIDTDGDGLPDVWEAEHCLNPGNAADANDDPDGDGMTNRSEYLAGTNPGDPADVLGWTGARATGAAFELQFTARAGRTYTVEWSDEPASGTWQRLLNVASRPASQTVTVQDLEAGRSLRFYRIVTPAKP